MLHIHVPTDFPHILQSLSLEMITGILEPERLVVDLRECYCNSGCCEMQMTSTECFSRGFAAVPPRQVMLEGFRGFDEIRDHTIADDFARKLSKHEEQKDFLLRGLTIKT